MAGDLKPDDGEVRVQNGVVVTRMAQEAKIEQLESDIAPRSAAMQDPAFYRQDAAYARWEALDG